MTKTPTAKSNNPIDAVIAWVDGSDPKLAQKRNSFLNVKGAEANPGAHSTRFASNNEIRYCLLSIFRFAPFIRNVYIVTDGQDPNLWDDIKTYYPERLSSVRIVDHTEIFDGFEQYLPTFNSISIGHMIWRIKGLSENFVYFNDDTFLVRSINATDWFINNKPVLRGRWAVAPFYRTLWNSIKKSINSYLLNNPSYQPRASFHLGQWGSALVAGFKYRYFTNSHTPHTVGRKIVEDFFDQNRPLMEKNISYRFRYHSQFTFISLSNHLQLLSGNKHIAKPDLAYLQPFNRPDSYIENKIKFCQSNPSIKFLCAQSLDMCTQKQQNQFFGWLDSLLGLKKSH